MAVCRRAPDQCRRQLLTTKPSVGQDAYALSGETRSRRRVATEVTGYFARGAGVASRHVLKASMHGSGCIHGRHGCWTARRRYSCSTRRRAGGRCASRSSHSGRSIRAGVSDLVDDPGSVKNLVTAHRQHAEFSQDPLRGRVLWVNDGDDSFLSMGQRPGEAR